MAGDRRADDVVMERVRWLAVVAVLAVTLAACSDDDSSSETAPPVPTAPSTAAVESAASTSAGTTMASTLPESSTTELNPVPTTPSPPSTTTTAPLELPPVSTLVPQVAPELLTPEQLDPNNVNNSRPLLPAHLPVIEAYVNAIQAFTYVASTWPINPNAPELVGAPLSPASLERNRSGLQETLDRGEVLNVSQGVTFRPYVVGPVTDTAELFDCEIAGHYWTKADTGELVPPDEIWPAGPGRIVEVGLRVNLVFRDGRWLVDGSQIDPGASA